MAFLIDSSVFITMERRGLLIDELALVLPSGSAGMAAITASELLVGVHRADSPVRRVSRRTFVEEVIHEFTVLPFDLAIARGHAQLLAALKAGGRTIGLHDLMIAATAIHLDYAVVTDNRREFDRVPGLVVVQPSW